ncbi:hypothetical protein EVAR_46266_1 [Eumeta japonica]|uniref:Uncharacterized protein n=1 Tax=Eumeta variegata TaxID=151549 RepID=A0A4C1Y5G2_EUMVA|nr:hypothetical protein EVAR_46266_1 [Eumeta japonica]
MLAHIVEWQILSRKGETAREELCYSPLSICCGYKIYFEWTVFAAKYTDHRVEQRLDFFQVLTSDSGYFNRIHLFCTEQTRVCPARLTVIEQKCNAVCIIILIYNINRAIGEGVADNTANSNAKQVTERSEICPFSKIIEDIYRIRNKTTSAENQFRNSERTKIFLNSVNNFTSKRDGANKEVFKNETKDHKDYLDEDYNLTANSDFDSEDYSLNSNLTEEEKKDILEAADYGVQRMYELYSIMEPKLYSMGLWLDENEPGRYLAAFNAPAEMATRYARYGYASLQAAARLRQLARCLDYVSDARHHFGNHITVTDTKDKTLVQSDPRLPRYLYEHIAFIQKSYSDRLFP